MNGHELLLEVGTEEIPARFLNPALEQLAAGARQGLTELRLPFGEVRTYGTPRRLALHVRGVASRQDDRVEEVRGPSRQAAFDGQGRPTRAALGFAKGQGVPVEALEVRTLPQGEYVFVRRTEPGQPAAEVLARWLPALVRSLRFPRSMRWGSGELRFARPIRWLVALLDEEVIPFELEGLVAGRVTRRHRFLAPAPVAVPHPRAYLRLLREGHVLADPAERRKRVLEEVQAAAAGAGGQPLADPDLVEEVTHLVETPAALGGSFAPEFLALPREVLATPMRHHQRYFPVVDAGGGLLPRFVAVANGACGDPDVVRRGNERVLAARLADARFFYDEDRRQPLSAFAGKLERIVFLEGLGSMAEKAARLESLVRQLAQTLGTDGEAAVRAARAARLAKADLATQMVYEFPELQGVMGREYARLAGEPPEVCQAIYEHHLPRGAGDELPQTVEGTLVALADKLDTLAGAFALGLMPTGSQDPLGLRRQALGVLRILIERAVPLKLGPALEAAAGGYGASLPGDPAERVETLLEFFRQRLRGILGERGIRHDLAEAVLAAGWDPPLQAVGRAEALAALSREDGFGALLAAFQRAANLAVQGDSDEVQEALLREEAEARLAAAYEELAERVAGLTGQGRYLEALRALAAIRPHVDRYFEDVLVMCDDPQLRRNRLALLRRVAGLLGGLADLRRVQGLATTGSRNRIDHGE